VTGPPPAGTPAARVPSDRRSVREALRALGVRPSRRLGQNFLVDRRARDRVVAAAAPRPGDLVLEVGPGLGALTEALAATGAAVLAVEVDARLAAHLRAAFAAEPLVRVLQADALDGRGGLSGDLVAALAEWRRPASGRLLVASNLPYAAATPIVLALLDREPPPEDLVVTVQREVADRIRAGPGDEAYGPLSVLVQVVARAAPVLSLGPSSFLPAPEVSSAVVRVTPDPALRAAAGDLAALRRLVHAAFGQRRKTLGRALAAAGVADAAALGRAGVDPRRRGEDLSPAEFIALAAALPGLASGPRAGETRAP